jgi:hypothetical protein
VQVTILVPKNGGETKPDKWIIALTTKSTTLVLKKTSGKACLKNLSKANATLERRTTAIATNF